MGILSGGVFGSQLVNLLATPLVTRLYEPDAYGAMASIIALLGLLITFSTLALPHAVIVANSEEEVSALIDATSATSLVAAIAAVPLLMLAAKASTSFEALLTLLPYWPLWLAVSVVIGAKVLLQKNILIKRAKFSVRSKGDVLFSGVVASTRLSLAIFSRSTTMLFFAWLLGQAVLLKYFSKGAMPHGGSASLSLRVKGALTVARKYKEFILFRTPQLCLNAMAQSAPVIALGALSSPSNAGLYALCKTFLALPAMLIGRSIGTVFYKKAADNQKAGSDLLTPILETQLGLFVLGIVPFLSIVLAGPTLFRIAFGETWSAAGGYAALLAPWFFAAFVVRPSVSAIPVLQLQKELLIFETLSFLVKLGVIYVFLVVQHKPEQMVFALGISGALLYVSLSIFVCMTARKQTAVSF